MVELSIIITTYNSSNIISNCLSSIAQFNDLERDNLEIIIVDNSDNSEFNVLSDIVKSYKIKLNIILIKSDGNYGYGYGNNIGIRHSKAKYIAIMNPDIILTESLFSSAIDTFNTNKRLAMLGYKQIGGLDLSFYIRAEYFLPILTSFLVKITNKFNIYNNKYMHLSGAFLFIRKEYFEDIQLFDENLFLYSEESDITKRFIQQNRVVLYNKNKSYIHDIGIRNEISANSFNFNLESKYYYLTKFNFNVERYFKKLIFEFEFKKRLLRLLSMHKKTDYYRARKKQVKSFLNSKQFNK